MSPFLRALAGMLAVVSIVTVVGNQRPIRASAQTMSASMPTLGNNVRIVFKNLSLPSGKTATVYSNGRATIRSRGGDVEERLVRMQPDAHDPSQVDKRRLVFDLSRPRQEPFVAGQVVVVFRDGVRGTRETFALASSTLMSLRKSKARHTLSIEGVPLYTNDAATNEELAAVGVDLSEHLFQGFSRSTLSSMFARAQAASPQEQLLDFSNAYRLHITDASVQQAVSAISKLPSVAYVSPNWIVSTMNVDPIPLDQRAIEQSRSDAEALASHSRISIGQSELPTNYAISASEQSLLNAPGVDAIAAYDEIRRRFHEFARRRRDYH